MAIGTVAGQRLRLTVVAGGACVAGRTSYLRRHGLRMTGTAAAADRGRSGVMPFGDGNSAACVTTGTIEGGRLDSRMAASTLVQLGRNGHVMRLRDRCRHRVTAFAACRRNRCDAVASATAAGHCHRCRMVDLRRLGTAARLMTVATGSVGSTAPKMTGGTVAGRGRRCGMVLLADCACANGRFMAVETLGGFGADKQCPMAIRTG